MRKEAWCVVLLGWSLSDKHQTTYEPRDAMRLLLDPERVRWASDPHQNPRWSNAAQTTVGRDGQRQVEFFHQHGSVDQLVQQVQELLSLPIDDFRKQIPPLKVTEHPKQRPWELQEGEILEMRQIVVPCIVRRAVSNLLADVLEATAGHLLSG